MSESAASLFDHTLESALQYLLNFQYTIEFSATLNRDIPDAAIEAARSVLDFLCRFLRVATFPAKN